MHLLLLDNAHFDWLLGGEAPAGAPRIADGGIAPDFIIELMRSVANEVGGDAAWLMVADGEAVGMISIKLRDAQNRWDIGYGVAPTREGRGHATAAVAALAVLAQASGASGLTAETAKDTEASPKVLQRNGFRCIGQFDHPEDGIVDQWVLDWTT